MGYGTGVTGLSSGSLVLRAHCYGTAQGDQGLPSPFPHPALSKAALNKLSIKVSKATAGHELRAAPVPEQSLPSASLRVRLQ